MTHKAIMSQQEVDGKIEFTPIVKDWESKPLLGPNSLSIGGPNNQYVFFTDSGQLGEASIANPNGSVFAIDMEMLVLKPLAVNCLAYPSGIYATQDTIYVCETLKNRLLRLVLNQSNIWHMSIFAQFSGRLGPIAVAVQESTGNVYVARFEFSSMSRNGVITVLNKEGEHLQEINVPNAPDITGLHVSKSLGDILYITDNSMIYKMSLSGES